MSSPRCGPAAALAGLATVLAVAGCTQNNLERSTSSDDRLLSVVAGDASCRLSTSSAPSGTLTFAVANSGTTVTEFYLLAADGIRILGEVENIGPGITRTLVLNAPAGRYLTVCKPGLVGEGFRATLDVAESGSPSAPGGDAKVRADEASRLYGAYVRDQTEQLLTQTEKFVTLYESGRDDEARALYPRARTHWERVEPVASSFRDLDQRMDLRAADLVQGQRWTGWHRLEKDLWPSRAIAYRPLSPAARRTYGRDLLDSTRDLSERVRTLTFGLDQIANGSRSLLDEVAKNKVTGEEERWSRTDLFDFQANLDGARVGFDGLRPILTQRDPRLAAELVRRFDELQAALDDHRRGRGFVTYDALGARDVHVLVRAVDALSEPLAKVAAAVV